MKHSPTIEMSLAGATAVGLLSAMLTNDEVPEWHKAFAQQAVARFDNAAAAQKEDRANTLIDRRQA